MKKYIFFITTAILFFCVSCNNHSDESKVAVLLISGKTKQFAQAGNKLTFEIRAYSLRSTLKSFGITSTDSENGVKTLFEIAPNTANYEYVFVYDVPAFSKDSMPVTLTAKAVDYEGNSFQLKCFVTVTGGAQLLPELTGIVVYSALSGKADAFSIQEPSQVFLRTLADSAAIDVYDYNPDLESKAISREWRTNTDVYFAKANNFNYSTAVSMSIKNTFQSSVSGKSVGQLAANDIVLFCKGGTVYGVIQITDIADNEDTNNDYYRFNIKVGK